MEAKGVRPRAPVTIALDGLPVATGHGAATYQARTFANAPTVVVSVQGEDATARVLERVVEATLSATFRPFPTDFTGRQPLHTRTSTALVRLDTTCPAEDFTWTLQAIGFEAHGTFEPRDVGEGVQVPIELPVGAAQLQVSLAWRDQPLQTTPYDLVVPPACNDRDGDGLCERYDCDDADPFVREGLPDLIGDGRNSDCVTFNGTPTSATAALAGDNDRDGYEGLHRPTVPTPEERSAILAVFPDRPEQVQAMFAAARGPRSLDCDDADPTVHPGAIEVKNGRDDDCDPATADGSAALATLVRPPWRGTQKADISRGPVLRVRDGRVTRSLPELPYLSWDLAVQSVQSLRTGTGRAAWLVVLADNRVDYTRPAPLTTYTRKLTGWVVASDSSGGLLVCGSIPLGVEIGSLTWTVAPEIDTYTPVESRFLTPVVTSRGVSTLLAAYRWDGDTLSVDVPPLTP